MPPKESAVDLSKHIDKSLRIMLAGGRQGRPLLCNTLCAQLRASVPIDALSNAHNVVP